jgi:hypothetical protein
MISVRHREVWSTAATMWGLQEAELRRQIDGLRRSVGAPWGADHKEAAAIALFALGSPSGRLILD